MNGKHLLDTNILVALFKNDVNVRKQIAASTKVFVPAIAVGELYCGAKHSSQVKRNMERIREFAESSAVLVCDLETAEHYGLIKSELKTKRAAIAGKRRLDCCHCQATFFDSSNSRSAFQSDR